MIKFFCDECGQEAMSLDEMGTIQVFIAYPRYTANGKRDGDFTIQAIASNICRNCATTSNDRNIGITKEELLFKIIQRKIEKLFFELESTNIFEGINRPIQKVVNGTKAKPVIKGDKK